MVCTCWVILRGTTTQQVGDLIQPDPLALESADRRDALDVGLMVEAEVAAASTCGSEQPEACVEVNGPSADIGAQG
jgi:hypothetical protein